MAVDRDRPSHAVAPRLDLDGAFAKGAAKRRFFFFTKTRWDELPRLRHQLAHLLHAQGHDVYFAQKPLLPWQRGSTAGWPQAGIHLLQHSELLHHKLRITPIVRNANAYWTLRSIRSVMSRFHVGAADVIVNFNYEYYFLRTLFPRNALITVLNDDFVSNAPSFARPSLYKALRMTCESSDRVLVTSIVLQEQLGAFCQPELFLPWGDRAYATPAPGGARDTLLFWGYINARIDFAMVRHVAAVLSEMHPPCRLMLVGPIEKTEKDVRGLEALPNVTVLGPQALDALPLDRVFGSLVPYRAGVPDIDAIVMPNKILPLLARGLPLLVSGLPRFMEADFVFRLDEETASRVIRTAQQRFDQVQPAVEAFVSANDAHARLRQFMAVVDACPPPSP